VAIAIAASVASGCSVWHAWDEPLSGRPVAATRPAAEAAPPRLEHGAIRGRQRVSIEPLRAGPPPKAYVVGPNDRLHINVYGRPELGSPTPVQIGQLLGSRVDGEGRIQLPEIGLVHVAGLNVAEIRDKLERAYAPRVFREGREPGVVVEILEHQSQPLYLLGEFRTPGTRFMDRQTNLLQALSLGQGLAPEANLRAAHVVRDDRVLPVDLFALLREGRLDQNIWMHPEDVIYVPDSRDQRVFVVGNVGQPGPVRIVDGQLTLSQAIASVGGFQRPETKLDEVRVIRGYTPTRGDLFIVDLEAILAGQAPPFPLEAGDIVYVPAGAIGDWNDVMRELLPTLQVLGGVANPFVQVLAFSN